MADKKENISTENIVPLGSAKLEIPDVYGIKSGVEGLDPLFFVPIMKNGETDTVVLNGYPSFAVLNLTGSPDTGKSLMGEQFIVQQASLGNSSCFVTLESPPEFVSLALRQRAMAMNFDFEKIEKYIYIIDASTKDELRDNILTFLNTLSFAIREYKIKSTVIDSITGFFEEKEASARAIVRKLFNFMKEYKQTSFFISQKRSAHEALTPEAAGGYSVPHILDGSIVTSKTLITTRYQEKLYKRPLGEIIRLIRIDGSRLSGHDTNTHIMEITKSGLVKVGQSLQNYITS